MTVNPSLFFTPQAAQNGKAGTTAVPAGIGKGPLPTQAADFMALLLGLTGPSDSEGAKGAESASLASLTAPDTDKNGRGNASSALTGMTNNTTNNTLSLDDIQAALLTLNGTDGQVQTETLAGTESGLALLKISISQGQSLKNTGIQDLLGGTGNTAALGDKTRDDLVAYFDSLLSGLPAGSRFTLRLTSQNSANGETADQPSPLIATGLSVEDLTALLDKLGDSDAFNDGALAGMIKILPPKTAGKPDAITFKANGSAPDLNSLPAQAAGQSKSDQTQTPAQDLAHKLNNIVPGGDGLTPVTGDGLTNNLAALPLSGDDIPGTDNKSFSTVLDILEQARQSSGGKANAVKGLQTALESIGKQSSPQNLQAGGSAFDGGSLLPPGLEGMVFNSGLSGDIFPDGLDWTQGQMPGGQSLNISSPAMMTSLVNVARHATQAHPATQQIAATISKAAGKDGAQNLRVRLNPPELGQVEIRMEMTKDKTAKIHITAEKPETFLMLQRDAQVLERAIQESGLDTNNGSLSFELAENGNLFDDGNHGRGGQNASGGGNSDGGDSDDPEIIEASVDWYVDPETGLTRYDILA